MARAQPFLLRMSFRFCGARLEHILSFVIQPQLVSTLAAVSNQWHRTCWDAGTWDGVVIETHGLKPCGDKALHHYKIWKFTRYVLVQPWMFRSTSFLLRSGYKPWKWVSPGLPTPHVPLFPSRVLTNMMALEARWRQFRSHWWLVGTPACLSNVNMKITPPKGGAALSWFFVGIADTNDIREVASIFIDKEKAGIVQRGPRPLESVQLILYGCIIQDDAVVFHKNACELSSTKCVLKMDFVSFGVKGDCMELHIGKGGPIRMTLGEQTCNDDYYYPIVACRADTELYSLLDISSCLSKNDVQ